MTDILFVRQTDFALNVRETIREFVDGNFLLLRVAVRGPYFPHRDAAPFVRVAGREVRTESLFAEISEDQREMRGYFPADVEVSGTVEFGYASQVIGSVPVRRLRISRLDAARIDPTVRRITLREPGPFENRLRRGREG